MPWDHLKRWKRHARRWERRHHGRHDHPVPPWARNWRRKGGTLFFRFARLFGCMAVLVVGGLAVLALLLFRALGGEGQMAALIWIGGCGLSLALPLLAASLAVRAFRDVATPLAGIMAAADAVAQGDLSVRVPERGPGDFGKLATSFNRMVSELQRSDRQRRNLTADVAHELRTPLHVIQGNLEGVLDKVYEPTGEHIEATLDETRLLARLVEDLRTLSLAEAGELVLRREPVAVGELLADVATSFSGQAEAAGIDLRLEICEEVAGLTIIGDVGRLDQVLGNLMSNGLRYTPMGGIITLGAESIHNGVRLVVADTGEGIPAEDLPYVFDRFWRGDRSRTHVSGAGSGLGLAIARQLVQAHGGTICVESQVGQGATFTVELPVEPSDQELGHQGQQSGRWHQQQLS